jgi:phage terminase large subunit-like protein
LNEWNRDTIEAACRAFVPGFDPWKNAEGYHFDHDEAQRIIDFAHQFCTFTNSKWAGRRFECQAWQVAFLATLFGWRSDIDNTRRFRKCLLFCAKKQGKTELAAVVANFLLFCDGEPAPEVVSAAGSSDQATKIFKAAAAMIRANRDLSARSEVLVRSIRHKSNGGTYKVLHSNAGTLHGGNLHGVLIDETFVVDAELIDALETSIRARRQPLILFSTTAGDDPASVAGELYHYACGVRDGLIADPTFLPVVYEVPQDADISNPEVWRLAAPSIDVTVPMSEYQKDYREALQVPRKMIIFRQFSLNQWQHQSKAWLPLEQWQACGQPFKLEDLKGCKAALGIDLSSVCDTTAVVAAIEHDGKVYLWPEVFLPGDNAAEGAIRRAKQDRAPYALWVSQGHLHATQGNAVDFYAVEKRIHALCDLLDVVEIQADAAGQQMLLTRLLDAGLPVVTTRQGWSLAPAVREFERAVITKELAQPLNPCFSWQVSCAATKSDDQDNHWIVKGRSRGRVDAVVSACMAINGLRFGKGREGGAGDSDNFYEKNPSLILLD